MIDIFKSSIGAVLMLSAPILHFTSPFQKQSDTFLKINSQRLEYDFFL